MDWLICFWLAAVFLAAGIVKAYFVSKVKNKRGQVLNVFNVLSGTVFVSSVVMFLPVYGRIFPDGSLRYLKIFLLSVHNTIRLFVVDGEFTIITDYLSPSSGWLDTAYCVFAAVLFVAAPVLTFSIVLSFFKNVSAYRRFAAGYFKDGYIFSELNEKSLTLAASLKKNDPRRMIVFTDVFEQNEEISYERMEKAREIGGICFKKDICAVNFKAHCNRKKLFFFTMGEDETENLEQSLELIRQYGTVENTHLFCFSTRAEGELLLTSIEKGRMKVRRVNEVRSLINRILYEEGGEIFSHAHPAEDGTREISAVIVGLGQYGVNMLKSLVWFCQMDGYRISIHAFDRDPLAFDRIFVQCPELLSEKYNGVCVEGEAQYKIRIHSGVDLDSVRFGDEFRRIGNVTYILAALGTDEENVRAAAYLRMLSERCRSRPVIQAIVHSRSRKEALKDIVNHRGQKYEIDFIGDLESLYQESVIMDSELEKDALERHLKWGEEEEFWNYEYNYRSSVAAAIHRKARIFCHIPGADKKQEELNEEEIAVIEKLEHRRWNAYMRAEGYIYSGSPDRSGRNDLGKMHDNLVDFSALTEEVKRKDSQIGLK